MKFPSARGIMRTPMAIIVLLSIIIGLIIVKIVDYRLQDISINMPAINLPPVNITLGYGGGGTATVKFQDKTTSSEVKWTGHQSGGALPTPVPTDTAIKTPCIADPGPIPNRKDFNPKQYASANVALKYTGITPEPNSDHGSHPAPYPRSTVELEQNPPTGSANGLGFYMDPKDMTPAQIQKFKLKAKLEKMTLVDYTNWLMLFQGEPHTLAGFHRANLRILLKGGKLTQEDMPRVTPIPPNVDHEYIEKINQGIIDNIPQPEYLGYSPWNIDAMAEIGSTEAIAKNRNLRHLDFMNPDEPLKTWVFRVGAGRTEGLFDSSP